ncbi:hypothetical protein V502_06428 [Pseudogymnoascus sp. VKM F-4520 (FW-2644)]|nr:hypothetical protein V502_06428 [Pseudogymnoascus sp. VKM F-4520 (FW-2644)]
MFVAMGDPLYPSQYERIPNYEGFTPQSAVSSFNLPLIYDSTLTTPVSLGADSPVLASKPTAASWGREQSQMNYPMRDNRAIFSHTNNNTSNRMKSNAKDSTLSLHVPQGPNGDVGLGFSTYNMFDSPQIPCPPTPYWGSFGVSGPQVTSPTPSLPSNAHSASQLSSASTPSMNHSIPIGQNNAPILIAPTPGQLRPSKRSHDSPIKTEHHGMQFPSRPLHQQDHSSPNHFNPPLKRESPPLSQSSQKRRKPSDPMTPLFNQNPRMPSMDAATMSSNVEFQGQSHFKPLGNNQDPQTVLTEEEKFLIHLRNEREPKPDWNTTMIEFNEHTGKKFRIPALQMRYSRLKERLRVWSEKDITALTRSKAEFEKTKWENVAIGMLKFDCEVKWSARACQQKYAELNPDELDDAPTEFSPDPEAYSESGRHNGYVNLGVQEYGVGRPAHHLQPQHPQQQQRQRGTPDGKSSREQSADVRADNNYKNIQVDANHQLHLLRQQQQLISRRMQLGQQQQ